MSLVFAIISVDPAVDGPWVLLIGLILVAASTSFFHPCWRVVHWSQSSCFETMAFRNLPSSFSFQYAANPT